MATDTLLGIQEGLSDKGTLYKVLTNIAGILDRSAIARHSDSPLETSLAKLQESTVSFNEKTMRWHDDQTNLMVKGTDPRVAEAMKISEKPRTVEAEIHWSGTIADFLSDIKDDTATLIKLQKSTRKLLGRAFFGKKKGGGKETGATESVEEGMEGNIADKNAVKNEKKQTGFLKGISDHFKKRKEESGIWKWFKDNWGKLALGLFVALAPMKWFPKIWEFLKNDLWPVLKNVFTWGTENPMMALGTMLIAWFAGPAGLAMLGGMIVGKLGKLLKGIPGFIGKLGKLLKGIPGFIKSIPGFIKSIPSKLGKAVGTVTGTVKRWGKNVFGKEGFLQKTVPSKLGTAAGTAKRWGRQGVEGVKSFGGTMKKGVTTIASGAKFVGGKAMEVGKAVGGKAGDWFKTLMGKFGTAGKFLAKMGKSVIQGLMTMGPYGWGIIGGIALGGLVWHFWKDITKVWDTVASSIKEGFTKIKTMVMGIFGNIQGMIGSWLRGIGAGMIADWIDPDGADKEEEKKEFTWGGFATELWNIYSGIWGKIIDFVKSINPIEIIKNVGKMIGGAAKSLWNSVFGGPDEAEADETESGKRESEGQVTTTETAKGTTKSQPFAHTSAYTSPTQGQGMGSDDFIDIPESKVEKVLPVWKEAVKAKKESEALDKAGKFNTPEAEAARERSKKLFREANELAREEGVAISDDVEDTRQAKTATVIPTPPKSGFKTKIPQVGHDKSAFKKQTSLGDRFKNLGKFLWGDKKADEKKGAEPATDEKKGAEPATAEDQKSVKLAVKTWVKNRKGRGKKSADREMHQYIQELIGNQEEARLVLLEKKLKSLDTEKVGGSNRWFSRSHFAKEIGAWEVITPGIRATKDTKGRKAVMHRKGMDKSSSIARAWSGEEGAVQVANERFPGTFKTADETATTAISKPPLSDFKSPLSKIRGKGSLLSSDKRADDYIAGVNAKKPVGMPFKELDSDQKAELFDFGKTLGVSKKQIEGGYFNYSSALDSSPKGYGAARQRISAAQSPDETAEKLVPTNPNQQGAALTAGQQQTASLSGGSAGGNVGINSTNNTNVHLGSDTSVVFAQQTPVHNPKMRNLTT